MLNFRLILYPNFLRFSCSFINCSSIIWLISLSVNGWNTINSSILHLNSGEKYCSNCSLKVNFCSSFEEISQMLFLSASKDHIFEVKIQIVFFKFVTLLYLAFTLLSFPVCNSTFHSFKAQRRDCNMSGCAFSASSKSIIWKFSFPSINGWGFFIFSLNKRVSAKIGSSP